MAGPSHRGALDGILAVSLEQAVAAPYASSRLADAGARVIKIERAEGDFARRYDNYARGQSAYFVWLNRGKQSLTLDIKEPGDAALLHRILARADIFIQNLAPGAAARAGFGSAELRARRPELITCDISGYGEDGPYRDMKAYDLLVQAETALASVTGTPDAPGRVGVSVCDIACGMASHAAILEALIARGVTGEGRALACSLFDGMADWMNVPLLQYAYGNGMPPRLGLNHPSIAPYGAYACADGSEIVIAIQNPREWARLCAEVLEDTGMAEDPLFHDNLARVANRPALDARILGVFGALSRNEVVTRLNAAQIAYGAVNSVADFVSHPQLRRATVDTESGPVEIAAPPVRVGDAVPDLRPVPRLGEHNDAIRVEFAA